MNLRELLEAFEEWSEGNADVIVCLTCGMAAMSFALGWIR